MDRRAFIGGIAAAPIALAGNLPQRRFIPPRSILQHADDELGFLTAAELAQLIRQREVSSLEVVDAFLNRIARYNPEIKAVVTLDADRARLRAREADRMAAAGTWWGPLHGVPFTLEDAHATEGLRSTWGGNPSLADYVPTQDGTVVARLKDSGAILLGKTHGPVIWPDSIFEQTNNPWDLNRYPGGSSAGPGAALAAGLSPLDVGLDTLGSTINPAHANGIFGMRPTERRVPLTGVFFLDPKRVWRILSVTGPMARSVADLRLALRIMAGPDGLDTEVPPVPWREASKMAPTGLRIAWAAAAPGMPVASDIRTAVEAIADELQQRGARVEERLPEVDLKRQMQLGWELFDLLASSRNEDVLAKYLELLDERDGLMQAWDRSFSQWDVFLFPADATPAGRQDATEWRVDGNPVSEEQEALMGIPPALSPVSGCPAVVIPAGFDRDGLPFGIQAIGRRWGDERLLAIAELVSDVSGGFRRPPNY